VSFTTNTGDETMAKAESSKVQPSALSEQLKDAFRQSGKSIYAVAKGSGISQPMLSRFIGGRRGITLKTAEQLAAYFEMQLVVCRPIVIRAAAGTSKKRRAMLMKPTQTPKP
jgi:transcriptional regulator with XRE-family HTH domain